MIKKLALISAICCFSFGGAAVAQSGSESVFSPMAQAQAAPGTPKVQKKAKGKKSKPARAKRPKAR